ncbi:anthrax toxin-like adenylyl cyclase domain-containing protein [Pseudomonas sp. Bout1]|uniref:anthrax toxin-like adenylyl cyclase domain-containing protein n=1 Tax=Pseudomonas sp. Bout1 TaxID=3048600 RepID=UPI002AB35A85|nr:anthrax toxin-like adenylyl cyclase domain-containing protein [Pseudomonas sp. Bout1]MDY7531871.1 anthrax toxin-like adenylyl cyclase domain-containing protein [Pseudomonas sp. Bout1]MEB0185622.1 anthrax toxin-like adenylyl cyclase domain-containing protein [Pseudomonas sp. Bout1]
MNTINTSLISPSNASRAMMESRQIEQNGGSVPLEKPSVESAIERVKGQTGIASGHLAPFQRLAAEHNTIIGVRAVEPVATGLIEAGHPTKDFHIKGKSADWGPQAGLICVDQALSKLEKFAENNPQKIAKANEQTTGSIQDGSAVSVPLTVSSNRLNDLLKLGKIDQLQAETPHGVIRFSAQGPSHQMYAFEGKRQSPLDNNFQITHQGKPVEVLAKTEGGKALTADYDLYLIGPHLSDLGPQDKLPVPDIAHSVFKERIDGYKQRSADPNQYEAPHELREDYESAGRFYQKEDSNIGNATSRIANMIPAINEALVGSGEWVVHHNADSGSPATDVAANYPVTFFLPAKLGRFDEVSIISDGKEMAELIRTAKDSGYHMPLNPLWEKEVVNVRRPAFSEAQARLSSSRTA